MCNGRERVGIATRILAFMRLAVFYAVSAPWVSAVIVVAMVRPGSAYYPLARAWARFGLGWFGIRVHTSGLDNLEPGRDYVVLANHRSHFDPLALMVAFADRQTRWVAKRELTRVPIFGYGLRVTGQILIDRSDRQAAVGELKRHLGCRGASVVFFPEGRRARSAELLPFKKGGAAFAIDAGLPIVPVAISGSERVLPSQSLIVRPGDIHISIGKAFDPGPPATADRDAVIGRVRDSIEAMLARMERRPSAPVAEAQAAVLEARPTTHV